jgi:putative oxidoreductase
MEFVFLLGRLIFGGFFIMNGINHFTQKKGMTEYAQSKHIPSPEFAVTFTGALLFVSGVSIVLGIFTSIALFGLIVFLFITSFTMHAFWKDTDPASKMNNNINFMKNMALLGACLMMYFIESWPMSL